jgi:hypothetical protein
MPYRAYRQEISRGRQDTHQSYAVAHLYTVPKVSPHQSLPRYNVNANRLV